MFEGSLFSPSHLYLSICFIAAETPDNSIDYNLIHYDSDL